MPPITTPQLTLAVALTAAALLASAPPARPADSNLPSAAGTPSLAWSTP